MESLGATFKHAREGRKLSLSQVAEATRISWRHLQNIEEGRYRDLPGGMYNRAFIRAYSEFLGLDPQSLISRYDSEVTPQTEKKPARRQVSVPQNSSKHRFHPLLAWSLMLALSTAGVFFSRHWIAEVFSPYFSRSSATKVQPAPTQPSSAQPAAPTPAAPPEQPVSAPLQNTLAGEAARSASTAKPPGSLQGGQPETAPPSSASPAVGTSSAAPNLVQVPETTPDVMAAAAGMKPAPESTKKLRLHLATLQKCWASVTADANRIVARQLEPGEERDVSASESLTIVLGNAGGVRLTINGKQVKPLGRPGDVVKVTITEQNLPEFLEASPTRP